MEIFLYKSRKVQKKFNHNQSGFIVYRGTDMKKLIKICLSLLMSISTVLSTGYSQFLVQADELDPVETIETYCS